jgi:hypothetical protein
VIHTYCKCDDATKCTENLKYAEGYVSGTNAITYFEYLALMQPTHSPLIDCVSAKYSKDVEEYVMGLQATNMGLCLRCGKDLQCRIHLFLVLERWISEKGSNEADK